MRLAKERMKTEGADPLEKLPLIALRQQSEEVASQPYYEWFYYCRLIVPSMHWVTPLLCPAVILTVLFWLPTMTRRVLMTRRVAIEENPYDIDRPV